jgi:ribosomal protein S14
MKSEYKHIVNFVSEIKKSLFSKIIKKSMYQISYKNNTYRRSMHRHYVCMETSKTKSLYKALRLNRLRIKHLMSKGKIVGLRKASW